MICPHLIDQMSAFCRCALDPERDHCGIYSELCHGNGWPCFADLGPWGAWRAVRLLLGVLYCRWEYYMDEGCELVALWYEEEAFAALDAVGWSP